VTGSLHLLLEGFAGALSLPNLGAALAGAVLGTVVGVLPGIGPSTTVALLIPVAFGMSRDSALIMMTAVYCGAMYGGSLTSVLLKVPGEASSVMTAIDGHEMAKQGRAGPALAIAAIGSWIGGTLSVIGLMLVAPPLAEFALRFGPAEYFGVMAGALLFSLTIVGGSPTKAAASAGVGLMLSTVGTDLQTGVSRFTLGIPDLLNGIEILTLIVGVFGVGEVLWYFREARQQRVERLPLKGTLWPSSQEFRASAWPIARGSLIGFVAGLLPGSGSTLASLTAYFVEKRVSTHPERFGHGAIEGVAAPETANNAATGGALIPLLTLGVPGSGTTAVLLGALLIFGIRPGPLLFTEQPELVWTVIASLYVSNVMLLALNLPLIRMFVRILDIPARYLMPMILALAAVGGFAANNSLADVGLVFAFGVLGYFMRLTEYSPAALVLAFVLGERMEQSFRQAVQLSGGDLTVFITSPISVIMLSLGIGALLWRKRSARSPDVYTPV
jgi:putative tricarboxylic transport membrane protein